MERIRTHLNNTGRQSRNVKSSRNAYIRICLPVKCTSFLAQYCEIQKLEKCDFNSITMALDLFDRARHNVNLETNKSETGIIF